MSSPKSTVFRNSLALLAVVSLVTACARQDAPSQGPGAVPVTVVTLATQAVTLTRELPGRTSAFMMAEVRPQVSGIVKQRLFTEGGMVTAGEPLYQLDDATYQADYASARAEVARAQAALDTARSRARRSAELVASNLVSQQENDNAVESQGVTLLIAPQSRDLLENITLDYVELEPGDFQFIFIDRAEHPLGTGADAAPKGGCGSGKCGCG